MQINEQEIRKALSILKPDNELVEVRIIAGKMNFSGYFTDADTVIRELTKMNITECSNVYFTLNQINPACYSRAQRDTFNKNVKNTTSDRDITAYRLLMIDFDPERPAGTSSTDAELELAKKKAASVYKYLKGRSWPEPLIAMSGNGYHLLYKIDMEPAASSLIKQFLETVNILFGDDRINIDTKVFNPSRICKLYGTVAEKGTSTQERPHRYAKIINAPDPFTEVMPEQLEAITALIPKEEPKQYNNSSSGEKFDLDRWIADHGVPVTNVETLPNGVKKYVLECCPFDSSHTGKDACIFQLPNGALSFVCLHDHCANYTWKDLRKYYEPDYDPSGWATRAQNYAQNDFYNKNGNGAATRKNAIQAKTEPFTAYYTECRQRITEPAAVEYLEKNGISLETAQAWGVGYDPEADPLRHPGISAAKDHAEPAMIFPVSDYYYEFAFTNRNFKGIPPKGTTPALFNSRLLYTQEVKEVIVCNSFMDAMSFADIGANAIVTYNAELLIEAIRQKRTEATMILCYNGPDAERMQAELQKLNVCYVKADELSEANKAIISDRNTFEENVMFTIAAAQMKRNQFDDDRARSEEERKKRTGDQMMDDFMNIVQSRKYEPIPTGITGIDRAIGGGFIRQQLVLLGAAPGMGKTALTQWIFETMAKGGNDCVYLNMEMSKEQMLARSIAKITANNGVIIKPTNILQGYKWTAEEERAIRAAADQYKRDIAPHMIYNPEEVTAELDSILNYIEGEAIRAEASGSRAPSIVIDYLQIIRGQEREDETATIKRAVMAFKSFAIRHNTIVFVIIAHNRTANKTGSVTQEAGRDTSALEYSADLQIGMTFTRCLPKYGDKNKDTLTPDEMKERALIITKCRWGEPGAAAFLHFNGETMTFTQAAPEFMEDKRKKAKTR